jgi:arylsulfatase A-like enzyme
MRPNIILLVLDTLRADHLGCYGQADPTSPNIDAFVEKHAVLFEKAFASSTWTGYCVPTLFTGMFLSNIPQQPPLRPNKTSYNFRELDSLPQLLHRAGYRTAGWYEAMLMDARSGYDAGFDVYDYTPGGLITKIEPCLKWLSDRSEPAMVFLHTFNMHMPYNPGEKYRDMFGTTPGSTYDFTKPVFPVTRHMNMADVQRARQLYKAQAREMDDQFQQLIDRLQAWPGWENAILIVTADHGEEFFEHGGTIHGSTLYDECIHVPLIIRLPGGPAGRRVPQQVRWVDIFASMLDWAGVPLPEGIDGLPLQPLIDGQAEPEERPVVCELPCAGDFTTYNFRRATTRCEQRCLRSGGWKFYTQRNFLLAVPRRPPVSFKGRARRWIIRGMWLVAPISRACIRRWDYDQLFDLEDDPGEKNNVIADEPQRAREMVDRLASLCNRPGHGEIPDQEEVSEEVLDQLRDLGYIQ